jgi:hypothetical protein
VHPAEYLVDGAVDGFSVCCVLEFPQVVKNQVFTLFF